MITHKWMTTAMKKIGRVCVIHERKMLSRKYMKLEEFEQILRAYHDSVFSGDFGMSKTNDRIKRRCHWKGRKRDIFAYVKECQRCQKLKVGRVPRAPLQIVDVACRPFDKIYIDIVGHLTPIVVQVEVSIFCHWYR